MAHTRAVGPSFFHNLILPQPVESRNPQLEQCLLVLQHFLRPAAEKLGLYHPGFGFHSFRREAVTALAQERSPTVQR